MRFGFRNQNWHCHENHYGKTVQQRCLHHRTGEIRWTVAVARSHAMPNRRHNRPIPCRTRLRMHQYADRIDGRSADGQKGTGVKMADNLFDNMQPQPPARARRNDPSTSQESAWNIEASGKAASQQRECLEAVRAKPGQTSGEIAASIGGDRYIPSRRLPELRSYGLVVNGEKRPCTVMATNQMTWFPTGREFAGVPAVVYPNPCQGNAIRTTGNAT